MDQISTNRIKVNYITTGAFHEQLFNFDACVVNFWAPWCMPCKRLSAMIDQALPDISNAYGNKIGFFKVNVDEESTLAQRFGVLSLPTVIGFKGAKPMDKFNGRTKDEFIQWVHKLV